MKRLIICFPVVLLFGIATVLGQQKFSEGAYYFHDGSKEETLVFVDGYFSHSIYDRENRTFIGTWGGPYRMEDNHITVKTQFHTQNKEDVGTEKTFSAVLKGTGLTTDLNGRTQTWKRIDNNHAPLAGVWRITGRQADGKINEMPLRDRRTLKILTGTRFQWVAINIKTGDFSGTGGGTYTFKDGTYTENIAFFSRDGNRVDDHLSFTGKIENGQWHHSGLSSKGDPIYEIWSKMEQY